MRKLMLCVSVLLMTVGGCASSRFWVNAPRQVAGANPHDAFESALATVRAEGYTVTEIDPPRGFLRIKSKVDGDLRGHLGLFGMLHLIERTTYLSIQVQPTGTLTLFASGYHVRGNQLHVKVADEIDQLAATIQDHTRVAALP